MIEPHQFFAVAEVCANGDEAHCRTAVGRAYYAAYHDSRRWCAAKLTEMGSSKTSQGTHAIFISELCNPSKANTAELQRNSLRRGMLLRSLHARRVQADYKLAEDVGTEDALQAIANAKAIIGIGI